MIDHLEEKGGVKGFIFSGFTELHLHCVFASCFFFLSFVYPEVEIPILYNLYNLIFLLNNYITPANLEYSTA